MNRVAKLAKSTKGVIIAKRLGIKNTAGDWIVLKKVKVVDAKLFGKDRL
jgi:hypothetical protein